MVVDVKESGTPNEIFARSEQPRGEAVYYIKANGTKFLDRVRVRTPTFANIAPLLKILPGKPGRCTGVGNYRSLYQLCRKIIMHFCNVKGALKIFFASHEGFHSDHVSFHRFAGQVVIDTSACIYHGLCQRKCLKRNKSGTS